MMDRRRFAVALGGFGLGALLGGQPARANSRQAFEKMAKTKTIPFTPFEQIPNHRQFMRDIVQVLSAYGKARNPHFVVLARNAPELVIIGQRERDLQTGQDVKGADEGKYLPVGGVVQPYLQAVDGLLMDGLFAGMDDVDQPTAETAAKPFLDALAAARQEGRRGLSIEYAKSASLTATAEKKAEQAKVLAFIDRDGNKRLAHLPGGRPLAENAQHITDMKAVRNFLPLLRADAFASNGDGLAALAATNYDMLIVDPFWRNGVLTADDVKTLQYKSLGSQRLVLAPLSVGRALNSRYYWKAEWKIGAPDWLADAAPDQAGQYIVRYWDDAWKAIIGQYMQGLVDLGFNGVLLDDLDSYLYFEMMMPIK